MKDGKAQKPRILLLDIETQPDLTYAWGVYDQSAIEVLRHWQLLSFSAEWLHGAHITRGLDDYPDYQPGAETNDDFGLVEEMWSLLDEADIVVAHHGKQFDLKKLNARFIFWGLSPPTPYKVVDTRAELKRLAGFSSNKLDWICKQLDLGEKVKHEGWPLWKACMDGDAKAWKRMKKYNRKDVVLLKRLYKALAPWMRQPTAGLWRNGAEICPNPNCGSGNIRWKGYTVSKTRVYRRFKCNVCGAPGRSTRSEKGGAQVVGD